MGNCYTPPAMRIEKIKENRKQALPVSKLNTLPLNQMTDVLNSYERVQNQTPTPYPENIPSPAPSYNPALNNKSNSIQAPNITIPETVNDTTDFTQIVTAPSTGITTPQVLPSAPSFKVPANPLLPPGYQEILNYNDVQYANGFYRTQIGRFVKVTLLIGSDTIATLYGYLVGVGINYILLQEAVSGNVTVVDFWNIKSMYIFYNDEDIKRTLLNTPEMITTINSGMMSISADTKKEKL